MSDFRTVSLDEVPNSPAPSRVKKELDEAVGATTFGLNVYEADPGERIPWGYHHHPDHEELFLVLSGELAVETPDGEFRVGPDEALFVPAGGRNRARAVGDGPVRLVAVGAPKADDRAVIEEECPACGEPAGREHEVVETDEGEEYVLYCEACGADVDRFTA